MTPRSDPSARRCAGDGGAVLAEFALVAPLLVVVALGMFEYGLLWQQDNSLVRGAQSAARTGATQGTDRYADYNVLKSIDSSLSALERSAIERVVVYRANSASGKVPAACRDAVIADDLTAKGDVGAACNIYSSSQVQFEGSVLSHFRGTTSCSSGSWDAFWCPTARSRGTDVTDPDYLGVYVEVSYETLTGIIPSPQTTLATDVVYRLDPCITGVSC
jgi:Flp pilus assembly protein TadG